MQHLAGVCEGEGGEGGREGAGAKTQTVPPSRGAVFEETARGEAPEKNAPFVPELRVRARTQPPSSSPFSSGEPSLPHSSFASSSSSSVFNRACSNSGRVEQICREREAGQRCGASESAGLRLDVTVTSAACVFTYVRCLCLPLSHVCPPFSTSLHPSFVHVLLSLRPHSRSFVP